MSRIYITLFAAVFCAAMSFGQNIKLKGSGGSIGGTVNVGGDINNTGATGVYSFTGTVNMNGTGGGANLGGSGEEDSLYFATLNSTGTQAITAQVGFTVNTAFAITGSAPFDLQNKAVNFFGTTSDAGSDFDATDAASSVFYRSGSAQSALGTTYGGTLGFSGAGGKSLAGATSAFTVSHTGGTLTVGNTLDINGTGAKSLGAVIVTSTLTHSGASDTLTIATVSDLTGGTVTNSGAGAIAFTNAVSSSTGTVSASAGGLRFDDDLDVDNAGGTVSVTGSASATFRENFTNSGSGTVTFGGTSTAIYNNGTGGNVQTVLGVPYVNLTISGAGDSSLAGGGRKAVSANLSASGTLSIAANNVLDMGTFSISSLGTGANSGRIMWAGSNNFVAGSGVTEFYSGTAATIDATGSPTYGILWMTGSGTKTLSGTITAGPGSGSGTGVLVAHNMTVGGSGDLTVNGDLDVEATGSITSTGTITVQ